jgi:hypothetical protein
MTVADNPDWQLATSTIVTVGALAGLTDQVTVGVGGDLIAPARAGRTGLTIYNPYTSAVPVFVGPVGVTAGTGYQLDPGYFVTVASPIAWYGVTASATATVSYEDE